MNFAKKGLSKGVALSLYEATAGGKMGSRGFKPLAGPGQSPGLSKGASPLSTIG
jgi:hypothetical protein